jgi:CheY-like chemotaxis protein
MKIDPSRKHRILVIDDNPGIHEDLRRILASDSNLRNSLDKEEEALFGYTDDFKVPIFKIDSAYHGLEGLNLIEKSICEGQPYALAFIDVSMPPGWDGVETTCKIWEKHPDLQVVMCTAYSDNPWEAIARKLGFSERMVIVKKPFDGTETLQLAVAMTKRWQFELETKLRLDNLEKIAALVVPALKAGNINLLCTTLKIDQDDEQSRETDHRMFL